MTRTIAALLLTACSVAAQGDMVELTDGRFVIDKKMTATEAGVTVHYENGDILIPVSMIRQTSVQSAGGGAKPSQVSAEDQKKLDKGLVRHNGRWTKKAVRDRLLARQREQSKKRIEAAMKHRAWRNRYKMKTKNFSFEYTISPEKAKEYAELMETYFQVFTREWKIRKPGKIGRLKVCFYHDAEYYRQVSGAPSGVIGYFRFVPPEELNFYYDRLDERTTVDVMFHETNHYLTHLIDPRFAYPSWVNESLAEYYGASKWDAEKKKMSVGHIQEGRLTVIQDQIDRGQMQNLEDLIHLPKSSFNAVHYAWGWSFVHFLLQNDKYKKNFKRYYKALAESRSIKKARYSFGMVTVEPDEQVRALKKYLKIKDLASLEKQWHAYIKGLEATSHRGWARGGALYLSRGMPIKARRFLETAIKMGNTNPLTQYNLARACESKRDYDAAGAALEAALELDPLNGVFYIRLAKCRERITKDRDNDEVRRLKRLALEIDPENDEVIRALGSDGILEEVLRKPPTKKDGGS